MLEVKESLLGRNKVVIIKSYINTDLFESELENCKFYREVNKKYSKSDPYLHFRDFIDEPTHDNRLGFYDDSLYSLTELNETGVVRLAMLEEATKQIARFIVEGQEGIEKGLVKPKASIKKYFDAPGTYNLIYNDIEKRILAPIIEYDREGKDIPKETKSIIVDFFTSLRLKQIKMIQEYVKTYKEGLVYLLDSHPNNIRTSDRDSNNVTITDFDMSFQGFEAESFVRLLQPGFRWNLAPKDITLKDESIRTINALDYAHLQSLRSRAVIREENDLVSKIDKFLEETKLFGSLGKEREFYEFIAKEKRFFYNLISQFELIRHHINEYSKETKKILELKKENHESIPDHIGRLCKTRENHLEMLKIWITSLAIQNVEDDIIKEVKENGFFVLEILPHVLKRKEYDQSIGQRLYKRFIENF